MSTSSKEILSSLTGGALASPWTSDSPGGREPTSASFRKSQIRALIQCLEENLDVWLAALEKDLGMTRNGAMGLEIGSTLSEMKHILAELEQWMKPRSVTTPLLSVPGSSEIVPQPRGVVLIITPWNVPVQLSFNKIAIALAAGNSVVLKPSELSPAVSAAFSKYLPRYITPDYLRIVEGGVPETTALLAQKWDMVLFTGSPRVGRIVYQAAAKHLTPTLLELGGKNPCIVDETANIELAAKRIMWGKALNVGQLCTNADYLLLHEAIREPFLKACARWVHTFFGDDAQQSKDYSRIITEAHAKRLQKFIEESKVIQGGAVDVKDRYVEITLVEGDLKSGCMQEEIFGPILPVFTYSEENEIYTFVEQFEKPLCSYLFSTRQSTIKKMINSVTSGSTCINDMHFQTASHYLPFGGVGESGIGAYHGECGFLELSHMKAVMKRSDMTLLDAPQRYPPLTESAISFINHIRTIDRFRGYLGHKASAMAPYFHAAVTIFAGVISYLYWTK